MSEVDRTLEYATPAPRPRRWPFILFCCGSGVAIVLLAIGIVLPRMITYQSSGFIIVTPQVRLADPLLAEDLTPASQPTTAE